MTLNSLLELLVCEMADVHVLPGKVSRRQVPDQARQSCLKIRGIGCLL